MASFGQTDANSMREMAASLENGGADISKVGRGVAILLKYQAEVVEKGFVTPAECEAMHAQERRNMKEAVAGAIAEAAPASKPQWGKIASGLGIPTPVLAFLYFVGQSKGWW